MGQEMSESVQQKGERVTRNRFEFLNIIGRGGFGKVWKVVDKKHSIVYALKEMQKVKVIDKKSINSIKYERELLTHLKHPFIVNMHYSFQDYDNLYLVLDYLQGGDLRYHVSRQKRFSEEQTRFFIACILLALEYIHSNKVIHRDIKPENLVFEDNGYLRLTDFGIAKVHSSKNSQETSGTPGYMSPEVMKGGDHSYEVDYFAVGVIGYEFMLGRRPYVGKSRKEIKEQMMGKHVQIKEDELPNGWSIESADFINKLLQRKPELRLGYNNILEVKEHPWLKFYPWEELVNKTLQSPFLLDKKDNYDKRYCEQPDKIGLNTQSRYDDLKKQEDYRSTFKNFTYVNIEPNNPSNHKNNHSFEVKVRPKTEIENRKRKINDNRKLYSQSSIGFTRLDNHNTMNNKLSSSQLKQVKNSTTNSHSHSNNTNTNGLFNTTIKNKTPLPVKSAGNTLSVNIRTKLNTNTNTNSNTPSSSQKIINVNKRLVNNELKQSNQYHKKTESSNTNSNSKQINHQKPRYNINLMNTNTTNDNINQTLPKKNSRAFSNHSIITNTAYKTIGYNTQNNNDQLFKKSFKISDDNIQSTGKKYCDLSPSYDRMQSTKHRPVTSLTSKVPFNDPNKNADKIRNITHHKVEFTSHPTSSKNISSQCTQMISTNCTTNQTKKWKYTKVPFKENSSNNNNTPSVNSVLKNYKISFHSRSASTSSSISASNPSSSKQNRT